MVACRQCGESLIDGHPFCSWCGSSAGVLAVDIDGASESTEVVTRSGRVPPVLLAGLGVVIAGLLALSILGTADERADTSADDAEVVPAPPTSTAASTPIPAVTSSTTPEAPLVLRRNTPSTILPRVGLEEGLFADSGLTLVTGSPLVMFDLDTGETVDLGLEQAWPMAVAGDLLIVRLEQTQQVIGLDLSDPEADPVVFSDADLDFVARAEVDDEQATITVVGRASESFEFALRSVTYDAVSVELLAESSLPTRDFDTVARLDAEFWSPPSGGVYRQIDGNWTRVLDGRVVAQGDGLVLVEVCDDALVCEFRWFTAALAPVDLPVPPVASEGVVVAGGRLLAFHELTTWQTQLMDLRTGEILVGSIQDYNFDGGVSVGTNDRYVTYSAEGSVEIFDVDTGVVHDVDLRGGRGLSFGPAILIPSR